MDTLRRGAAAIRRAEHELRGLLADAANAARYDEVLVLGEWAKQLHALLSGMTNDHSIAGDDIVAPREAAHPDCAQGMAASTTPTILRHSTATALSSDNYKAAAASTKRAPKRQRAKVLGKTSSQKASQAGNYPRFLRDGNALVKIGWSKKEKKRYEHKAPKPVLDLLVASLSTAGRDGLRFIFDDLLPLSEPGDGAEVPSYQAYLCLAWLRSEQLVEQHGRQGYSIRRPDQLTASVEEHWGRLARRRAE
jgi:hypothetical protein